MSIVKYSFEVVLVNTVGNINTQSIKDQKWIILYEVPKYVKEVPY